MTRVEFLLCLFEQMLRSKLKERARVSGRSKSFFCELGVYKIGMIKDSDQINQAMLIRRLRFQKSYKKGQKPNLNYLNFLRVNRVMIT